MQTPGQLGQQMLKPYPRSPPHRGKDALHSVPEFRTHDAVENPCQPVTRRWPTALPLLGDHGSRSVQFLWGTKLVAGLGSHWAGACPAIAPSRRRMRGNFGVGRSSLAQILGVPVRSHQLPIAPDNPAPRVRITPDSSRQLSAKRDLSGPMGSYGELWRPKSNFPAADRSTRSTKGKQTSVISVPGPFGAFWCLLVASAPGPVVLSIRRFARSSLYCASNDSASMILPSLCFLCLLLLSVALVPSTHPNGKARKIFGCVGRQPLYVSPRTVGISPR
jgi:hypothetical protein